MLAAYAARLDPDEPLGALEVGEVPEPELPEPTVPQDGAATGWALVDVRAAALNHHDLWSLRGVGLAADRLPMVLGCDAAGVGPDGTDVVVHAVVADPVAGGGDETLDPGRSLLSERHPGTLAERVAVPRRNLVPKPPELSYAEVACLPTAWLTAYRMLTTRGGLALDESAADGRASGGGGADGPASGGGGAASDSAVLVQGAGGGVATAAIALAGALGARVYATSRDGAKRERAAELGATVLETGARLPERVDVVIETVGEATFEHSLRSLKPGGRLVVSGATSGHLPAVDLRRVFFLQLSVLGSTMGSRDELEALLRLMVDTGLRPVVDSTFALADARDAFARLASGDVFGKVVITV